MKASRSAAAIASMLSALGLAALLSGCGNFWQNPGGTSTGTTASTTTLTAANSSVTAGGSDSLSATVSPTAATGTVTFLNNGTSIGTGTLSSGSASYSATFSTAGTETLTASYGGNSTYASSTSSAITVTVTAAAAASVPASLASGINRRTNLVLDPSDPWTLTATAHLHNLAGVVVNGLTAINIDDGGHCVYYSGSLYFAKDSQNAKSGADPKTTETKGVFALPGGGFLAPEGTTDLGCE